MPAPFATCLEHRAALVPAPARRAWRAEMLRRASLVVLAVLALGTAPGPTLAAEGGVELALDRRAVATLVAAGLPEKAKFDLASLGQVTVAFDPPSQVAFSSPYVDLRLKVRFVEAGLAGEVEFRLRPVVRAATGTVEFEVERARGLGGLSAFPNLAPLLPRFELKQPLDLQVGAGGRRSGALQARVRSVVVRADRLWVEAEIDAR